MQTRQIPSTGESIPIIGLGTWQTFDVGNNEAKRIRLKEILKAFVQLGGRLIDSSPMYGTSEKVVGDLTTEIDIADQLFMATKVWTSGETAGIQQMHSSMQKMQTRPMDLIQIHNLLDYKTHIKTLEKWKAEGIIRYIGLTHYKDSSHEELTNIIEQYPIDFIQINYSIQSRNVEKRLLPTAKDKGIATLINLPFQAGHLFALTKNKALPNWAKEYDINSWGQFFLKYILANPAVTCVIPATSNLAHLMDNMAAGTGIFPDKKRKQKMITYLNNL